MRHCFPSWTEIRKRTGKSKGGSLLRAYAEEYGRMEEALEDYKKIFFLVNYKGHEDDYPSSLMSAVVGSSDSLTIDSVACTLTDEEDMFLSHLDSMAYKVGAYILFHKKLVGDADSILYSVDGNQYRTQLVEISIWNAFDEFAKFAGIERFEGETNKELEARTYAIFKDFPNPTDAGLKRAIRDALVPVADIDESEIIIHPIDETLDLSDTELADIYEQFAQFNRDLFRTKVWNIDNWENGFQKQGWMSHSWDKKMPIMQDGVGNDDSLKVSYLKDLDTTGLTDVTVSAYKKDFNTVRRYISKNPVEGTIQLTLEKYKDSIEPMKVGYSIRAYDVKKIEHPEDIRICATQKSSGVKRIAIEDIATEIIGVESKENGRLEPNKGYTLRFTPKSDFSNMSIEKCLLKDGKKEIDLRNEHGSYHLRDNTLVSDFVRAHVTEKSELVKCDNIVDTEYGLSLGQSKATGSFDIDVQDMENELVTWSASCREVGIMDTPYILANNGFELSKDKGAYVDARADSLGTIVIGGDGNEMTCNSFSFCLDESEYAVKQGAVLVTVVADGKEESLVLRNGGRFSRSYDKRTKVSVVIQKYGQNAVSISDIRMTSYDVNVTMSDGTPLRYLSDTVRLPVKIKENATLHVDIQPYVSASPVIEYVHIGGSLKGACYEVSFDTDKMSDPVLDIDTECNITLLAESKNGTAEVVGKEKTYTTKNSYYNPYENDGQVVLDLSAFASIVSSEPTIESKYKNGTKSYITLKTGESASYITIVGTISKTVSEKSIADYLIERGEISGCTLYATKAGKGVILKKEWEDKVSLLKVSHDAIGRKADSFNVVGLPEGITASFVYGDGSMRPVESNSIDTSFKSITLSYAKANEYVAYNSAAVISKKTEGINIVNTFQPLLSMQELHLYEIDNAVTRTDGATIYFENTGDDFCLGANGCTIAVEMANDFDNKRQWPLEVRRIVNRCILSNEILLEPKYLVDGAYHELSEYIVKPPKGIVVNYGLSDEQVENTKVPSTCIQKLAYSNVKELRAFIDGYEAQNACTVMSQEGIVIWQGEYAGKDARVVYKVSVPSYLTYTKEYEDILYSFVSNKEEALKLIETKHYSRKKDGDKILLHLEEHPDLIVTKCTNPAFTSISHDDTVDIVQTKADDRIAVKSGYIYDDGQEFYRFNDEHHDDVSHVDNVEFHNVGRLGDEMVFHMKSKNFLPNSDMRTDSMASLCHFDFTKGAFGGASKFGYLTACESCNLWSLSNMKASLAGSKNGVGISFRSDNGTGYAAIDLTQYADDGLMVSLYADGDLSAYLAKEPLVDGMPFTKSVYIDMDKAEEMELHNGFLCHRLESVLEEQKLYLVVSGTNGTIDDIIISEAGGDFAALHKKNIEKLGIEIEERLPKNYVYDCEFTKDGAAYDEAVCSSEGVISTSTSVEYGLTKAAEIQLSDCSIKNADCKNGSITSVRDGAVIKTKDTYVKNSSSAYALYVKVNSILAGARKGFDIEVYTSPYSGKGYTLAAYGTGTNLVEVLKENINSYVKVIVRAKSKKVIDSIEIYARYAETSGATLISLPKESGSFTSKVYDLGISANYKFAGADSEEELADGGSVVYEVRGLRQNDDAMVFTEWKQKGAEFEDYRMFQFRVRVKGSGSSTKINRFRMVAI